jgi:hypothetical protein
MLLENDMAGDDRLLPGCIRRALEDEAVEDCLDDVIELAWCGGWYKKIG